MKKTKKKPLHVRAVEYGQKNTAAWKYTDPLVRNLVHSYMISMYIAGYRAALRTEKKGKKC